jgi:P-type Ca2+ transporter type 2C
MPRVSLVHTKVPGRTRYKVDGLRRVPNIESFLERSLAGQSDILAVSANHLTGTLLITYNSGNTPQSIAERIETVLSQWEHGLRRASGTDYQPYPQPEERRPDVKLSARMDGNRTWHGLDRKQVLNLLDTHPKKGLSLDSYQSRYRQYGPNRLPQSESRSQWELFLSQFTSLPTYLLAGAAGVSLLTGGVLEAAVILGVVAANAIIGFTTESKAEQTIQSLKALVRPVAEVIRAGRRSMLPAEEVVPGDLMVLKPGFYVAADCRILSASHLNIDESMLTGESMPVTKRMEHLEPDPHLPIGERFNMAYMGTLVTGGEGMAVAVMTGRWTEIGQLQILLNQTHPPQTPMERQLNRLGDQLVLMCLAICSAVFGLGFLKGFGLLQMLRMAISLAAAAVPEGLPAAATINFALGISRMRKHRVLIRHLPAMETLGAMKTICLDKTGTLTLNQMAVRRLFIGDERLEALQGGLHGPRGTADPTLQPDLRQLLTTCILCNDTRIEVKRGRLNLIGSATETALIRLAADAGMDVPACLHSCDLIRLDHRSESRLFMSSLHRTEDGDWLLSVKGSPPEVLALCDVYMVGDRVAPLTDLVRLKIETENERMAGDALRVLGFAFRQTDGSDGFDASPDEGSLVWLGLVGMADPVRPQARALIEVFHRAGVETVMITGDQSATAYAVADELNLSGDGPVEILDSSELNQVDEATLQALAKHAHVYARVSPAHKLKIVQVLQATGRTVAMTGDGINDGPALKAADIGIAMGRTGTDVARDVADIVLEEDQLEILAAALSDGRAIYDNIRKTVRFLLATNISEIMLMFVALAAGGGFPLNVMQLLWINLISDILPGLALSLEAPEPDILTREPRDAAASIFNGSDFRSMVRESTVITGGALAAYGFGLMRYGQGARAGTLAFQSLTIGQLLHAISCRSEHRRPRDSAPLPPNPYLSLALGGSLVLQALTLALPPLRGFLGLGRIGLTDLAVIAGGAVAPLLINQAAKPVREQRP